MIFYIIRYKDLKNFQREWGEKNQVIYKESEIKMASDFSTVSLKGRRIWINAFKVLRGNYPTWNPININISGKLLTKCGIVGI